MANLLFKIHSQLPHFSRSEKKVAQFVLDHPHHVTTMSTEALANATQVSTATVVRFGRKICPEGGYPALKLQLSSENRTDQRLYDEIKPDDTVETLKEKLMLRLTNTLTLTNQKLTTPVLHQAADLIEQAQPLFVFGLGASALVAGDFQQKFLRLGKTVITSLDGDLLKVSLIAQHEHPVLILISNSGQKREIIQLATIAQQRHIPVILLTHNTRGAAARLATLVLQHDDSQEDTELRSAAVTSLFAQFYASDLLYYVYLVHHYHDNVAKLISSREVIKVTGSKKG